MFKNYLIHNGARYYRGQYKTLATAQKWGGVDLARFCEKLQVLKKENQKTYISIEYSGEEVATIKQK